MRIKTDSKSQLSSLIKDTANDSIKLSTLLLRAKTISKKLRLENLQSFISNELDGEYTSENLPKYRIRYASPVGIYKNQFNGQVQEVPLHMEELCKQLELEPGTLYKQYITQSVIEMEDFIKKCKLPETRITFTPRQLKFAKECSIETPPWFLFDGYYKMSLSVFPDILSNIRSTLLDLLIDAEEEITTSDENNQQLFLKGKPYDAVIAFLDIIRSAKKSIVLIDNYVSEKTLNFFTEIDKSVSILIITQPKSKSAGFDILIDSFSKQYRPIEVKTTTDFHDRFVVIDNKDYFNLGASIKDAGNKIFMFTKINDAIFHKTIDNIIKTIK